VREHDPDCWCETCVERASEVYDVGRALRAQMNPFLGIGSRCKHFSGDGGNQCQLSDNHSGEHSFCRPKTGSK
jgi:hypothetical protein